MSLLIKHECRFTLQVEREDTGNTPYP